MVNMIPGWNLPALNHLPKLWTNQFAHVNGKQPYFYLLVLFEVLGIRRDFKLIIENNWIGPPH